MADNRYYYFKDAKGNRHTVDKTAYDKDPMGFAKAFPGARMEVIDRKTGRRGDVNVKDASRVGDFGAHLFTGRTITRGKGKAKSEKSYSSALGRAQERVAQEKWGGGVVTQGNTTAYKSASAPMENDSELVRGLKNADAVQRLQAPMSYSEPGAVKQMVKQTRDRQHIVGQNVEQAGREFTNRERDRRNAPAFDLGNEDVNNNIVKTRGQLEDELEESSRQLVDKQLGGYINNSIQKMFKDATVKGVAAEDVLSKASPFAYMVAGKAYNEALDPDKLMNQLSKNAEKDMAGLFSDPKMQKEIVEKAASFGIDPEDYVKNYIAPGLQAKIAEEFEKSELSRNMPKSTAEYIIRGVNDSMIGTILSMGMMSKKQRQYAQQGMAMTDNGENPYVKPGMGARVARGTLSFAADAPVFGALGKAGAAVAGKVMGNGVAQAARIANTSLRGRIVRMATAGAVSQGVTGVLYGSTNAAVQNYSTGDDTSIGNTVKLMTMGGLSEGASWATMGGIGGAVGAGIYNVSGVKRIPAKVFQLAMEGVGMHMGGNVAKMIEGHDTDWLSVEGNLEACANVVALKLTHARLPKRYAKDGKKESYLDMVKRNLANLMVSDGQRASFGGYTFTNEEKEQLFGSNKAPLRKMYERLIEDMPLRPEGFTHWALRTKKTTARGKGEESYKDTDAEFVKTAYDEIMADNTIPWDTKAKFSALVMGTVPSSRPMMEYIGYGGGTVSEYSKYGELLSEHIVKTEDERDSVVYSLRLRRENQRLSNAYGAAQIKDEKVAQETLETVAETFGFTAEQLKAAMDKDPLKRSEEEQNACVALRKTYEGEQFPEGTLHPEQSQTEGKDVVEENNLGTENPNNEAVAEVLNNMNNAEKAFNAALESNDVLKQEYERLAKEGLSEPQIYMELINSGLTQEQLVPFADYINTKAKAVGMYRGTEQKIAETVQKHVEQWSYKGELNGEKQEGGQMLFVKDNNGRLLIVGAGDVAFDNEGRARESVGDMLSVLDPNTKEMDFVSKKDVQLDHVEKTEDYAKNYQEMLEVKNSVAYAESEKGKEKSEESDTKTESVVTPKEGASAPGVEDVKPIGEGEKKNPSDNGNGSNETLTFADGSPVPMMKDTKGRETADYSQMTPEHGAEWMSSQFGENAEAAVDGQIKRAEKMLKEAEKIKVDYTGDLNDAKEAEAQKTKAVDAAKAELELYTNIKKVMTANKVKAGMEKVGSVGEEGSVGSVGEVSVAVREKFEKSKKIPGRRGSITLPDGTKITGQYFYGEVSGLTPSHDPFNDFNPVNEDGSSSNSRSYKDKESRLFTEKIGRDFGGQALKNVPVVQDGILLSGNGTTMGKQLAERYGTDGKYYESLSENAEGFGWTPKQIEEAGFKGTVYFVPDKKMPLTSKTFDLFNRQETKSIGNTEQSVKNAKVLSTDEVGAIIAEIEGSGSLDAFFNNPTAINSLLKRLIDKGVIGLNEVAGLREGEDKLSAAGKDFVKNLLLGSVFSENTIRMMGADAMLKTKALNGIRAVTDNMKLGDYALMKEIDQAVQLLYEARQGGSGVDAYLRTPAMFGENAADRFDPISQAIALALEGKAEDFRELMMAYNRNAAPYADANQMEMFGERPTNEEFIKEFLKLRNWKDYETRHSSKEGNGDAGSSEGTEPQAPGGNVITSEADYNKAVEQLKEVKGEERERILDQMGEYVKEFAKSNGYDEPVVLRTKQDLADAAKTENDKTIIENMPEGAHYPGYYEDGKIHIYLEGSTGSEELRETFEHESVHADNEVDPSRVEALVYSITDMNTLTREELERVVEVLSNMKEYTERASEMDDVDALYMLADEALAHLVTYAQEHGKDAMSEITDNPTLLNIAEKSLKERENDRRRKEGLAKSGDKTLERKNIDDVSTEENGGPLEGDKEGKPENDNGGSPDRDIQAGEEQREVDKAVKNIATEITKKTGIEVVTDEKEAEEVIRESEETDSDLKYHKETDEATLEELENGETVKVYRAMQVIDGKLYPPMAAAVNGKRVEANELGVWIRADENPDLAIPDIDPKTKEQKVDKKTGELKWKFKLDKGGKDATGKKATDIPAAYNPYWHTSRSPLNDQFKSAWIRPNIVVVECEVPVSELSSGYKAERAKDAVGEVDWKSGVVSGEVYKQTGRARKVILSRWCKPVRVLSDAEVAQRAKEFVGDAKVEIPENVLTPRQRIEFEKVGFKIGAPEKGVKKSDQINEALKRGLQIDNSVKEFRTKDGEVYGFTDGEKIYLDTRKMKPETPLHEYAHLWCDMLRRVNPKEWESVKKLFDKVEGLKEEVQKLYPELEGDALYEEMITTYSGREGTKKLEDVVRKLAAEEGKSVTESVKAQGFLEKVKEALTKYWKGVADMLGIHFTTAEEVADKVLADWAKGVDPRGSEKGKVKSEESDSKVEGVVTPKGDIKDATEPKGDKTKEEPSKTNPLAWLAHTAEMYKDEQVQKAKEELAKAKESGDASDIKRATADMKQAMETKLRGNGIGLVERRRIIGREIGKILGEEAGKAEAEKIDKPWKDMDGEERMATAEKNPLTEEEIRNNTSEENKSLIEDAVDYVNGNHGIVQQIAYLKIYDDVRNRHENAPGNSGAEDRTQLAAADNGGSQELGVGTGREGGGSSEQLGDGTSGEGRSEQLQHGSQNSSGQPDVPTGEGSHSQGEGEAPGLGGVPTGNTQRERGSNDGSNGATVRHERGRGSSDKTATTNGGWKPTAKQGTHFADNGTLEQKKQNTAAKKAALKDALKNWAKLGRGELGMNLAGLNSRQIEYLPEVMKAVKDYGVALIDEGIYRVKDWIKSIREAIGEDMKGMKFSDKDIDGFIEEMWNSKYTMNGETHTIGEWADIYGQEKLRKELAGPLTDKAKRQIEVEDVPVKIGDKANIEETLPFLLPQQQEDVLKAETQFFGNEHADREHAYGKGYMFTNGTGTGKTYTGLGIAKRLVKQGKGRILIVTPSQKKVSDWIKDGRNLNMEIRDLDSWAKDRGTTATTESGEGVVITTFANFGVNKKLLETKWDAVIYDESHRIMENKKGTETARSMQHYMVTNRDENHCFLRLQEINKDYQKQKSLGEQFNIERNKEIERIRNEYKASHPSATPRDVANATSRMLPKEIINFTPGDYASFPKLGEIHSEFKKAFSHYINEVMPKLEAQAKSEWKDTKTIFLSATPFNTRENLDYAEGYIFKYPEVEKGGRMSGRTQFYLDHFGAAYKFRYSRLEQSTNNPEAVAKQEIAFSDYLQDTLGTMSGRIIDSPYDYSRDFPTVSPDHAEQFNQAVQDAVRGHGVLADAYRRTIGDYNYGSALFETMKVANIIERIKAHLDAGRKVVIFHRRVETKEPLKPPFALMLEQANHLVSIMSEGEEKKKAAQAVRDFRKKYADLLDWEQTLDYSMPREQIAKVFGKDNVLFFSGKESSKVKDKAVDIFNDDNSGKNIIVIQEASGKEGISLHDTTGKHQRVCITLALPQSPITALQIEGRTYRIGNKSNAIFEYPILGLNSEMMLFGQKFNNQVSTTENLALGSQARSLRDSFANGILEHSGVVPIDQQGVGGKEFDAPKDQSTDGFDNAVLDYYSNQKLNSRNREGVDYFPTPEPLGYKMMEWANMGEGDTVMEPSAGHGAIARYAPKGNQMVAIEPSQSLFAKLQLKAGGLGRKFVNTIFENYDISNKHDVVVMNPPFGTAGATAIAHLGKAFKHLEEGGRVVAIIPRGSTDKKFDKWIEGEKTAVMRAEVELPDIVFKQAGTKVVCRVVVVDKISNEAMRAKAGRVEKVSLGGHYDKIEDFFEDLRDIEMPDRIIDTNTIMQKKSKQTAKDLKELKDVTVNLNEHGINVHVRGDRNDYSIMFDLGEYNAEQRKSILSGTYERFEEYERYTRDETSQAVIAELKKLTCKLAGMTEEEMQRYLKKQNDGKGVMYRVEHAAEVYGKAKGGSKGQRDGRVVPEDVDKKTSEGIEKKFNEEIGEVESDFDSKEEFMQAVSDEIFHASRYRKSVLENKKKQLENELRRKESNTGEDSERVGTGRLTSADVDNKTTLQGHRDKAQDRIALAAINRELDYRRVRAENLRNTYGLSAGSEIGFGEVEKIFRQLHTSPELGKLFAQTRDVLKRLGVDFGIQDEINSGKLTSPMGYASPERDIRYSIDGLVKTSSSKAELPVTILHEMIHEGVNGAIHLVKSGKADGMLTPKQIEAVETISEIYDRAVGNQEKFGENKYGLANEYEFAAQMADPRQRKALDLGVMDRVVNFAKELMRKGDRSVWERVKDAVKKLFEVSDKSKMDKAIEDILEDFNKTVDDAAMADVDENGWSYDKGVVTPEKTSGTSNAMSERIIKTVEKVAKRTGGKVKMVNSVEEIENPKVRKDIENGKQVTGWYDEKTGEVHLYMPNIHDTYTAEKTVWHETVGHKGMRGLLGDKFNDYMRSLWMDLDNPINAELRAYVKEKMNMNHLGFYDAIEEFIAKSAEDGKGEPGFWNYIKNKVTDALHEIGYRVSPNVKDVKYMLWLAKNVQKHGDSPLWKMRAEAVRWKIEHEKTLSVVEENGMMYDNNGKKHGLLDLNKKDFDEATDGHVHYRTSPMTASKIEEYNRRLSTKWYAFKESTVDDMQSLQEAMQTISGVKDAYADIPSAFNPLQCHNRMGSMVMQMCERYDREYTEPLGDAFKKVVSAMPGKDGAEQTRNANLYFIKKHGLERNRVLFVRDWFRKMEKTEGADSEGLDNLDKIWKGERSDLRQKLDSGQIDLKEYYRQMDEWIVQNLDKDFKAEEHDYSGMHGIYDVKKGEEYDDANVIDEVMSTESQLGADLVKSFWDAKKKATDFTIDQEYANGFMDKNGRDHLKEMFDWYVPLRKFDETVAEDVYGYISGGDTKNDIGSVIEKARGRESLSDVNVLAQISALAKSSILNGGKNVERQHFMRFVEAYEKGDAKDRIFVEIKPWVEKHVVDGNEVWEEVMPNIPENSTQEQINDILNTFEDTMKAKQAHGEAKIARRKSDIGYKFERSSDMNQHIVNVYVNGRVRRFVCQGNPRAAQAINGMLRDSGTRGWVSEKSAELNRFCAQLNTSLNPDFISSNLMRDLTFASANLTKEGMGYTWDFCMEYAKNWASMARRKDGSFDGGYLGMFRRYKEGRSDANNQKERWFKEFMDNGGETGFVSLKKYEDIIKEYENLVKTGNKEGDRWLMKKLKEGGVLVELANEVVENVARYSTYCVSRKRGRSIGKSIYDAKEVSSNFNRHGSGDAIKSLKTEYDGKTDIAFRNSLGWFNSYMKNHTMFYNAGVQGANLFTKNLKHAPKTAAIAFGAMPFGLNIAVALLNQLLISQEDEKKRNGVKNPYAELPEWKRRNNLCIYWGGGKFKTIPMGIELRAFYGLGDIAAGYMVDESLKSDTPIGLDIIGQMAQLVPASDFLGHHSPSSGIKELGEDVILSVIPTTAKPELELAFNRDWTGRPIYRDNDYLDKAPRWKRAYDSTNDAYMTINKWANKTFNGIDNTNEDLKGSGMLADAVDFFTAPYGLQHIVEGYTGGAGATIGRTYQTGKSLVKGVVSGVKDDKGFAEGFNKEWDKVNPNTIPFYRVFNYTPKEGNDMQRTKSKWYNYADELERLKYNMQQMKTNTPDTAKNIHNAASKFKLSQSKDGRKLKIYEAADRYITAKRRILKRAKDKAVVEAVNEAINRKMQEAVEDLDRIE
jgi:predicted RNA methylase